MAEFERIEKVSYLRIFTHNINKRKFMISCCVFFYYMIDLLRLFQKRSFVSSSEHENQNVATLGTLFDQLMLTCK